MNFALFLEQIDKSLRRKMERVVRVYLGYSPKVKDFGIDSQADWDAEFQQHNTLFGRPSGYATPDGKVRVPDDELMSALHEVLHTAGFMPDTISEFWNEGITQAVSEDIATQNNLQIPKSYPQDVQYVRESLLPFINIDLQTLARQYGKVPDKALFLTKLVWKNHAQDFANEEDWGTNPIESIYESFQRGSAPGNFHLDYLKEKNATTIPKTTT